MGGAKAINLRTPAQERKRLNQKVRRAFMRVEHWKRLHELASDELAVFMLRHPTVYGRKS